MVKSFVYEILNREIADKILPIKCLVDKKSLRDSIFSTKTVTEKKLKVDISLFVWWLLKIRQVKQNRATCWLFHKRNVQWDEIADCPQEIQSFIWTVELDKTTTTKKD